MSLTKWSSLCLLSLIASTASAERAVVQTQSRFDEGYVPKINAACGITLSFKLDIDSLTKNNTDIQHDQTDGVNECGEPMRYLWYTCQTAAGKAAVKAAKISHVVCKGVAKAPGALTIAGGTITATRAVGETQPYLRSRKQFEAALKVSLPLDKNNENPYQDDKWRELRDMPNPVTSTTTYCIVNGAKVQYDENVDSLILTRKEDAVVKCWNGGEVITDEIITKGKRNGFYTFHNGNTLDRMMQRDGKRDGEWRSTDKGKITRIAFYKADDEVWSKEYQPTGKLAKYSRHLKKGYARVAIGADGKIYSLDCSPDVRGDAVLHKYCGFDGATTTQIYDGTGKVNKVVTYTDGVLSKEGGGNSAYSKRSQVSFKGGKKQGEERVMSESGKLESVTTWNAGVRDGKETFYDEDGKKVIDEIAWKAGQMQLDTQYYLNGKPSSKEVYASDKKKSVQIFWDSGKVQAEGVVLSCEGSFYGYRWRDWCEDGLIKSYYESGAKESEALFKNGQRDGTTTTWWESGKQASIEEYAAGVLTKAKEWDKEGKLKLDEAYEKDGSRKNK